jgi:hypothetical protein
VFVTLHDQVPAQPLPPPLLLLHATSDAAHAAAAPIQLEMVLMPSLDAPAG